MFLYTLYIGVAGRTCHIFFRLLTRFGSISVETMIRRTRCRVVTPSYYWWCSVWSYLPNSMLEIPSTAGYVCRDDNVAILKPEGYLLLFQGQTTSIAFCNNLWESATGSSYKATLPYWLIGLLVSM